MSTRKTFLLKTLPVLVSGALFATVMHASAADKVLGSNLYDIVVGDFDGDQMSDVIRQGARRELEHSAILAAVQQADVQRWQDGFLDTVWNRDAAQLIVGDFNGDASADLLIQRNNPVSVATVVHAYADGRLGVPVQAVGEWYLGLQWDAAHRRLLAADFNGDGRDDLFLQGHTDADRHALALASADGTFTELVSSFDNAHLNRSWSVANTTLATGDFDGNGRYELLLQPATGDADTLVVGADQTGALNHQQTVIPAQHLNLDWSSNRHRAVVGDFNGDGKDDVFLLAAHVVEQSAYVPSTGTSFERIDRVIDRIADLDQLKQVLVGDFDADGIDDLILLYQDPSLAPTVLLADAARAARLATFLRKLGLLQANQTLRHEAGEKAHTSNNGSSSGTATLASANTASLRTAASTATSGKAAATSQNVSAKTATAGAEPAWQEYGGSGGSFRVDESGAATYSIAIATPPGSGGVSPKLSLNYSSQGGNGVVGMGWSLGGLSAISRCRATKETDGANLPMSFGTDAKYCLGGSRLIAANQTLAAQIGSCPAGGSVLTHLVPEIYSGTVVTACSSGGATMANPSYFAVFQKDGSVSYYGNFNGNFSDATMELNERNSSGTVVATNKTLFWAIARFSDSVGNYIDHRYSKNVLTGEHLIRTVLFTGNDAAGYPLSEANAPSRVNFIYEPRHDPRTYYNMGSVTQSTKRLDYVEVRSETSQFRRYDLYYAPNSAAPVSQLEYVQECRESTCLPATKFSWNRPATGFTPSAQASVPISSRFRGGKPMDLNGDGVMDYTWLSEKTQYDRFYWQTYITRRAGNTYTLGYPDGGQPSIRADVAIEKDGQWYPFDFNGDGRQDVLFPNGNWKVLLARADGALEASIDTLVPVVNKQGVVFSDVTGDALPDLVQISADGTLLHINPMTQTGIPSYPYAFGARQSVSVPQTTRKIDGYSLNRASVDSSQLASIDADMDGINDIVIDAGFLIQSGNYPVLKREKCVIHVSVNSAGVVTLSDDSINNMPYQYVGTHAGGYEGYTYFQDINGDGVTDIVSQPNTYVVASHVSIGTGKGFVKTQSLADVKNPKYLQLIDFNVDGLIDIAFPDGGFYQVKLQLTDGSFSPPQATTSTYLELDENVNLMADMTGDGQPDNLKIETTNDNFYINLHLFADDHSPRNVITKIEASGTKAGTQVFYKALSRPHDPIYIRGGNANTWVVGNGSPVYDVTGPMFVVSEIWRDRILTHGSPGQGMINQPAKMEYKYNGLRLQTGGRGTLGFESVSIYDQSSLITTTTTYEQLFPYTGMPKLTRKTKSGGTELSKVEILYTNREAVLGGIIPFADWVDEIDKDQNGVFLGRKASKSTVDEYGNVTTSTLNKHDNAESSRDTGKNRIVTVNDFGADSQNRFYARLKATEVSASRDGAMLPQRNSAFEYYNASAHKHLLKYEIVEPNGNEREYLRTEHAYDSFGNKIRTTTQSCHLARPGGNCQGAADLTNPTFINRTGSVEYDARGRFPVRTRNHFGHIMEEVLERNAEYLPTKVKGAAGVVTTTEYTTMGRARKTSDSTGNWSESYLQRCDGSVTCLNSAVYRMETVSASGARGIEHYDLLGRVVAKQAASFLHRASGFVTTLVEYDKFGNPVHSSWPFFSNTGTATQWEKTTFDLLGRVTEVRHPNNTTSTSQYSGLQVTQTNELGQTRVETRNALGELTSVRDNAGKTIYYTYDGAGRLDTLSRVDNIGLQSDLDYDRLGRKIYMWDADKSPGTRGVTGWRYEYNALGELTKQTDPRGYTSESWYDALGRVTRKQDKSNTGTMLINHSWSYASADTDTAKAGQLIGETDAVSGYSRDYHYDALGRPTKTLTRFDGNNFEESTAYNSIGQVEVSRDITGKGLRYKRNSSGYVYEVQDADNASIVFQHIQTMDAKGNVTQETLGNGVRINRSFHASTGLLERKTAEKNGTTLQNLYYETWDAIGNLKVRVDTSPGKNLREVFDYDAMNRLTTADARNGSNDASKLMSLTYDTAGEGNILTKTGIAGSYTYGTKESTCTGSGHVAAGPHALTQAGGKSYCYDANGNQVSGNGRTLTYANTFDLPTEIIGSNNHTTRYSYITGGGRYKRTDTVGADVTTTYFVGSVEVVKKGGTTEYRRAIPNGLVTNGNPHYILTDHLGSTDQILDCTGNIIQSFSFDAFGKQREAANWKLQLGEYTSGMATGMLLLSPRSAAKTFHGFTGHEMVDELGLIHMNGRMYDNKLGRFLQADPYIQAPKSSQSLNRYSYLMNNPLNGTDPTGFISEWLKSPVRAMMRRWSPEHASTFNGVASAFCGPFYALCYAAGSYDNARAHGASSNDARRAAIEAGVMAYVSRFMMSGIGLAVDTYVTNAYLNTITHLAIAGTVSEATGGKFKNGAASAAFWMMLGSIGENDSSADEDITVVGTNGIVRRTRLKEKQVTYSWSIRNDSNGYDDRDAAAIAQYKAYEKEYQATIENETELSGLVAKGESGRWYFSTMHEVPTKHRIIADIKGMNIRIKDIGGFTHTHADSSSFNGEDFVTPAEKKISHFVRNKSGNAYRWDHDGALKYMKHVGDRREDYINDPEKWEIVNICPGGKPCI